MNPTEKEIKEAQEWKKLADDHNLSLGEMYELVAYVENIKRLTYKNETKLNTK